MPRRTDGRLSLGKHGEELASAYLLKCGYRLVARNWRTRAGEIDIVAQEGPWLVFVEVRSRRAESTDASPHFGPPEDSITPRKRAKLADLAEAYLFDVHWEDLWRIDVIAIEIRADGSPARLNHLRDAVGGAT
jgi:putative endonuclease